MLFGRCCTLKRLPSKTFGSGRVSHAVRRNIVESIATLPTALLARPRLGKDNAIKTRQDNGASAI
jgi:hypothetical protein